MLTESIILIGMPGSGKTTVGKLLAKRTGTEFVDTDSLIIKSTGEPLQRTLEQRGRSGFLECEREELLRINPKHPTVISTGGSAVLHPDAMSHLKEIGKVVFLDADLPLIEKRISNADNRGIVFGEGTSGLFGVYAEREPLYFKYADIRVHIRGRKAPDIVNTILKQIKPVSD